MHNIQIISGIQCERCIATSSPSNDGFLTMISTMKSGSNKTASRLWHNRVHLASALSTIANEIHIGTRRIPHSRALIYNTKSAMQSCIYQHTHTHTYTCTLLELSRRAGLTRIASLLVHSKKIATRTAPTVRLHRGRALSERQLFSPPLQPTFSPGGHRSRYKRAKRSLLVQR